MTESITISRAKPAEASMDYTGLRAAGIKYIEQVASRLWTDYNVHDPGITILEMLSYAITDLGYRTAFPIQDLLATKTENEKNFASQFFSAKQILPVRAFTEIDYRKLFIDIEGVKNAWLFKAKETLYVDCKDETVEGALPEHKNFKAFDLNGIYNIKIQPDELTPEEEKLTVAQKKKRIEDIIKKVTEVYHCNRSLCEDLAEVSVVGEQKVIICANVEITAEAKAEEVYAEMLYRIVNYLTPDIPQYSLQEMLELKKEDGSLYRTDEIFDGPVLQHGFMTDTDVMKSSIRKTVYTSDLLNLVMDVEGVVNVKEILLNYCDAPDAERHEWCLPVADGKIPTLCTDKLAIHFFKDVIPVNTKKDDALNIYKQRLYNERIAINAKKYDDYAYATGTARDTETYTSVIHHLPLTYGVSNFGLPAGVDAARKAKAKQLKAYLLFYDQVLANYFSQLANTRELYKVRNDDIALSPAQSYFYQKVKNVAGIDELVDDYANFDKPGKGLASVVKEHDSAIERRNRFLDHLISRFAENFNEYVLQLYSISGQKAAGELMINKASFLSEYPAISATRHKGYVYKNQECDGKPATVWDTENVSGLEHRLCRLLGIANFKRRTLSSIKNEVYEEKDNDGISEFRFRLIDPKTGKIVLSSSTKYLDKDACTKEFIEAVKLAADSGNYKKAQTGAGKFYFNVVNEINEVVARRIEYFNTEEAMNVAINFLVLFVKENYRDEGMFVVEHILLRPDAAWMAAKKENTDGKNYLHVCADDDCKGGCEDDPYSFRVSVVLPAESKRFSNMDFREYIEKVIRLETPAHIYPKICWVNHDHLLAFEQAYKKWLEFKRDDKLNTDEGLTVLKDFIEILYNVKNIYPPGKLNDCGDDAENPMILGRTNLGNM